MAADFLAALTAYVQADTNLIGVGLGTLHYGSAPGSDYPYLLISHVGGKYSGRNFTRGYFDDTYYRVAIFTSDMDQAADLGRTVTAEFDAVGDNPLTFDDGRQASFLRMDPGTLVKIGSAGTGGHAYIWQLSYVYHVKISRERP